jgi:ParB/RepB/Spo0J family partition protein
MLRSLPLSRLYPHPGHANRLSKAKFATLVRHLQRSGQYEPIVVRRHPSTDGVYQILNGRYRVRALKQLGHRRADCVIFDADDSQAAQYLLSLNQLTGRDNVYKKAKLIERLCRDIPSRDLAKWVPDSKTAIEKLNALSQDQPLPKTRADKPFLVPMTFFMSPAQHAVVAAAFERANTASPRQRGDVLLEIAQAYLERFSKEGPSSVSLAAGARPEGPQRS